MRIEHEWIHVSAAVRDIASSVGGDKAAQDLIAEWISDGRLSTRLQAIECFPYKSEMSGDLSLTKNEAVQRGFVKVDPFRTRLRLEITNRFWAESRDWDSDYAQWNWDRGDFIVGFHFENGEDEPTYWLARNVYVMGRWLKTLVAIWQDSQEEHSTPITMPQEAKRKRSGRHEDTRRADWTGELVSMALARDIPDNLTANELIIRIEDRLIQKKVWGGSHGPQPMDRTTVYRSAQKAIEAVKAL